MDKVALQDLVAYTGWAWDQIKAAVPDDKTLRATAPLGRTCATRSTGGNATTPTSNAIDAHAR